MRVAVFGKSFKSDHLIYVKELIDLLHQHDIQVTIYNNYYDEIKDQLIFDKPVDVFSSETFSKKTADFLFTLGGDGTLLETIHFIQDSGVPILGINTGRLGFLSSVAKEEMKHAVEAVKGKKYRIDKRSLLKLITKENLFGNLNYALNELTILKKDTSSMITIHAYMDEHYLNSYWADGLIISTPTGSTAYSLSCGGPIVLPEAQNFIITPIAPHNLNVRPIIIPDTCTLSFKVEGRSEHFLVALDSRTETIDSATTLTVKKQKFTVNLVQLEEKDFLTTIRNKMMWGIDRRN